MVVERTEATTYEAIFIVAICFGWAIALSTVIALTGFKGHAFTGARLGRTVVTEVVVAGAALIVLQRRGFKIGQLYPAPSLSGAFLGVGLYVAGAFVGMSLMSITSRWVSSDTLTRLMQGPHPSLELVVIASIVNGAYEEVFLLGFLQRTLQRYPASFALGIPLLVRILYHTYQGPLGTVSVLGYGLVVGLFYLRTSALFPVVLAHILGDIVPFVMLGAVS